MVHVVPQMYQENHQCAWKMESVAKDFQKLIVKKHSHVKMATLAIEEDPLSRVDTPFQN